MAGANSKSDAFLLAVKHHVEAFHDDGAHHCAGAGLGHSKLVAVLLSRGHVFHWTQVLLHTKERKKSRVRHPASGMHSPCVITITSFLKYTIM